MTITPSVCLDQGVARRLTTRFKKPKNHARKQTFPGDEGLRHIHDEQTKCLERPNSSNNALSCSIGRKRANRMLLPAQHVRLRVGREKEHERKTKWEHIKGVLQMTTCNSVLKWATVANDIDLNSERRKKGGRGSTVVLY